MRERGGTLTYELGEETTSRNRGLDLTRLHLARQRLSSREVNALPHVARLCAAESPYHTYTGRVPHFRRVVQWQIPWSICHYTSIWKRKEYSVIGARLDAREDDRFIEIIFSLWEKIKTILELKREILANFKNELD